MKKVWSLAVLFAGISFATFAQENNAVQEQAKKDRKHHRMERKMEQRTPEEVAKFKTDRLDKQLKFTDAQRSAIYAVQLEQAKQAVEHRQKMTELHKAWRTARKGSQQKMAGILTAEQQQQWKESYAQHRKRPLKMRRGTIKNRTTIEQQAIDAKNTES